MDTIIYPQWRDENSQLRYPFADDASLTNGTVTIPEATFLDGRLYPIGGAPLLFLSRISVVGSTVTVAIRAEGTVELATAEFASGTPPADGQLVFTDSLGRPAGMLLSDPVALAGLAGLGQGTFEFTDEQTPFVASVTVVVPDIGFRGFVTADGDLVTGDIWLIGEDGIVLRAEGDDIRVDIVGDPFAARKLCEDEELPDDEETPNSLLEPYCPVLTINKTPPDEAGNFQLVPGSNQSLTNLLRIETIEGVGLRIKLLGLRRFRGL